MNWNWIRAWQNKAGTTPAARLRRRVFGCCVLLVLGAAASGQAGSPWPRLEEVIIVSKTHFDIGYTDLASKVVYRCRKPLTPISVILSNPQTQL